MNDVLSKIRDKFLNKTILFIGLDIGISDILDVKALASGESITELNGNKLSYYLSYADRLTVTFQILSENEDIGATVKVTNLEVTTL